MPWLVPSCSPSLKRGYCVLWLSVLLWQMQKWELSLHSLVLAKARAKLCPRSESGGVCERLFSRENLASVLSCLSKTVAAALASCPSPQAAALHQGTELWWTSGDLLSCLDWVTWKAEIMNLRERMLALQCLGPVISIGRFLCNISYGKCQPHYSSIQSPLCLIQEGIFEILSFEKLKSYLCKYFVGYCFLVSLSNIPQKTYLKSGLIFIFLVVFSGVGWVVIASVCAWLFCFHFF